MPLFRRLLSRRVLVSVAVAAVVLPPLAVPSTAVAEDANETVVGEFVQAWQEFEEPTLAVGRGDDALLSFVRTEAGTSIRVDTHDVEGLEPGARVEVSLGGTVDDSAATEDGYDQARDVLAAEVLETAPADSLPTEAASFTNPTHQVTVVMVNPSGGVEDGTTLQEVVDQVNGPVADFWWEQARESVGVVAAHDWMDTEADCSDPYALLDEVATAVGFVPSNGAKLLLYVTSAPVDLDCSYAFAEMTGNKFSPGYAYVREVETSLIAHQLGHNLTLGHSSALQCDGAVETGSCQLIPEGDFYDVMGLSWGQLGSLNLVHASTFAVLFPWNVKSIYPSSPPETVTLAPVTDQSGVRAVQLWGGPGKVYWLEYRPAAGRDSWLGTADNPGLQSGVFLRAATGLRPDTSLLLDGTPSGESGWDDDLHAALPVGTPIRLAEGDFTVTVQSISASGATLRLSGAPPTASRPTGNWERLSASGATLTVSGWALDADAPADPLQMHVYVDGRLSVVTANESRPDVGAAFPGVGDAHGFSWTGSVLPGTHELCVYALDAFLPSSTTSLGCRTIASQMALPVGNWETLSASGSTLTVGGWTFDPDGPTAAAEVHVYVDGQNAVSTADQTRTDVGAAFPQAGASHGFNLTRSVPPGEHRVCVYVIDRELPWRNTAMGCRTITTGLALPLGNYEVLSASGSTLTVGGWALDPDTVGTSVAVHVYVDGRGVALTADRPRTDIGAAFPGAGNAHGFSWSGSVAPGTHNVCAYAIDAELPWRNTPLGCRTVATQLALPIGNWEALSASGPTLSVSGWTLDPDTAAASIPVHVYVDGRGVEVIASGSRTDVGAAFSGAGDAHGFSWSGSVAPGPHTVCLYAIDVDLPWRNTAMGCRTITTQLALPVGNWDALSASGSTITLGGWTFDPDSPTAPAEVHVYVDGQNSVITADQSRPDVGAAFPHAGAAHGFGLSRAVAPGVHRVCVYVIDTDLPWRNTAMGCRSVTTS